MIKYCKTCRLCDKNKNICMLAGWSIDQETDFCSKHKYEVEFCSICHTALIGPSIIRNDIGHIVCERCNQIFNTCQFCECANKCEFETNPDPMPKIVMKQMRQGNMVMQTQVKNPDRVAKFCHGCTCWLGDGVDACGKEFNVGCYKQNINFS